LRVRVRVRVRVRIRVWGGAEAEEELVVSRPYTLWGGTQPGPTKLV